MQISDFRLFLEVAELGSFTKAAIQRQTVQSHISRQISQLERHCGGVLFRRTGRGVELTEYGAYVAQKVRFWLNDTDTLITDLRDSAGVPRGEVRLGLIPSAATPLMTEVYKRLQNEYPQIKLNVREGQGGELDALLDTGAVDMAILFRYEKPNNSDETLLSTANTYLVSSPGLSLTLPMTVDFKRLKDLPLVLPRKPSHWRSILDETAKSKGFTLTTAVEADSLRLQKSLVADNHHLYALLGPFAFHDELRAGRLQAAKVISPELKRYVTLAHPKQGTLTKACRIVSEIIIATVLKWRGQLSQEGKLT
jgi:LysR family nitrogen assimilation transcriptional regulator